MVGGSGLVRSVVLAGMLHKYRDLLTEPVIEEQAVVTQFR
jgi:hypothetical protein